MDVLTGQTIDKYRIERVLGEGSMGAVYQARDLTLQRVVALKVMHAEYTQQEMLRERFLQEARAAARLGHAGIVRVHDFGQTGELLFIDMEFIPGDNLRQLLAKLDREQRWVVLPEAIQIVREVAIALDYAHDLGVLHRDIKPANIMLKPRKYTAHEQDLPYQPVITDLGLAKLADSGLNTQAGLFVGGTPAYMSPEQAQGLPLDARSDVYTLGVLLYELITGQRPFPIRNYPDALRYHGRMAPPPPRTLQPALPPPVEEIILQALAKRPDQRFASAGALAQALATIRLESVPTTVPLRAASGAGDLHTLHQQSLHHSPAPPISSSTQDRLQILRPDGSTYVASLARGRLSVGRGPDNDVVINDPRISRRHVLIEFDGANYRASDNGSDNGVYLGAERLPPHTPTLWTPDKTLRIGQHHLLLQREAIRGQRGPNEPDPSVQSPHPVHGNQDLTMAAPPATTASLVGTASNQSSVGSALTSINLGRWLRRWPAVLVPFVLGGLGFWLWPRNNLSEWSTSAPSPTIQAITLKSTDNPLTIAQATPTTSATLTPETVVNAEFMPTSTVTESEDVTIAPTSTSSMLDQPPPTPTLVWESPTLAPNALAPRVSQQLQGTPSPEPTQTRRPTSTPIVPPTPSPTKIPPATLILKPATTALPTAYTTVTNAPIDTAELLGTVRLGQPEPNATLSGSKVTFIWSIVNPNLPAIQEALNPSSNLLFELVVIGESGTFGLTAASHSTAPITIDINRLADDPWRLVEGKIYQWSVRLGRLNEGQFEQIGLLAAPRLFVFHSTRENQGSSADSNKPGN